MASVQVYLRAAAKRILAAALFSPGPQAWASGKAKRREIFDQKHANQRHDRKSRHANGKAQVHATLSDGMQQIEGTVG
jgi:hypothetical protein